MNTLLSRVGKDLLNVMPEAGEYEQQQGHGGNETQDGSKFSGQPGMVYHNTPWRPYGMKLVIWVLLCLAVCKRRWVVTKIILMLLIGIISIISAECQDLNSKRINVCASGYNVVSEFNPVCNKKIEIRANVSASSGFFREQFKWSIAGTPGGTDPNIYSELIWKDLQGLVARLGLNISLDERFVVQVAWSECFITSGKVTDTDYQQDNRNYVSFYGLFDSDEGSVRSANGLVGYRFYSKLRNNFTFYLGYSAEQQNLYLLDHSGIYDADLRSSYRTMWRGPLIKLEAEVSLSRKLGISPAISYHQLSYHAKGNWNLISEFEHPVSYRHHANGYGTDVSCLMNYKLSNRWKLFAVGEHRYRETGKGVDMVYRVNGQRPETQMNGVLMRSVFITGGISFIL